MRTSSPRPRAALVATVLCLGVALCAAGPVAAADTPSPATASSATAASSRPFWSDEFSGPRGSRPAASTWTVETGNRDQEGWGNNELQYYTDSASTSSLTGSGQLAITARKASAGQKLPCYPAGQCRFTSARLTTEGTVSLRYGRADVRAKLPTGRGLLPAIWMLGDNGREWPGQGEIDIAEVVGHEPGTVYGTAHGPTFFNENGIGGEYALPAAADEGWHVYSVIKEPKKITWLVDGTPYFTLTPKALPSSKDWVFDQDMHLLLNVAVGGDWPGSPAATTRFPATMTVDYVRLYGSGTVHGVRVGSAP